MAGDSEGLKGLRILLAEDQALVAMELSLALEDAGAVLIGPVSTVQAALAMIDQQRIDAVVLDIGLEDGLAFPVAEALTAKSVPFVFMSGYADGQIPEIYRHVYHCEKPCPGEEVVAILARVLTVTK